MDIYKARPINFHRTITENLHKAHENHRTAATICYTITAVATGTLAALDKTIETVGRIPLTLMTPVCCNSRFKKEFTAEKLVTTIKQIYTESVGLILRALKSDQPNKAVIPDPTPVPRKQKTKEEQQAKAISEFNENLISYCQKLIIADKYHNPENLAKLSHTTALVNKLEFACQTDSIPFVSPEAVVAAIVRNVTGDFQKLALAQALVANGIPLLTSDLSSDEIVTFMRSLFSLDVTHEENEGRASLIHAGNYAFDCIIENMIAYNEGFTNLTPELNEKRKAIFQALFPAFSDANKKELVECCLKYQHYDVLKIVFETGYEYPFEFSTEYDGDNEKVLDGLRMAQNKTTLLNLLRKNYEGRNLPPYRDFYPLKNIYTLFRDKGYISLTDEGILKVINEKFAPGHEVLMRMLISPEYNSADIESAIFGQSTIANSQLDHLFFCKRYAIQNDDVNNPYRLAADILLNNLDLLSPPNQILVRAAESKYAVLTELRGSDY